MSEEQEIQIIRTADGSNSLYLPHLDETYHSRHGAVQESLYVFLSKGFEPLISAGQMITILEVGFGTGLNALLTLQAAQKNTQKVHYITLEPNVLSVELAEQLNYPEFNAQDKEAYLNLHRQAWDQKIVINEHFTLEKRKCTVQDVSLSEASVDLIYYDAFGPRAQEEMWHPEIFHHLFDATRPGGVLVTYCAKGQVRRDLEAAGYRVERLQGPPGKREMIRATRPLPHG